MSTAETVRKWVFPVARCTVERLMCQLGLRRAVRGKVKRTTIAGAGPKPADRIGRNFEPLAPNRLWSQDPETGA